MLAPAASPQHKLCWHKLFLHCCWEQTLELRKPEGDTGGNCVPLCFRAARGGTHKDHGEQPRARAPPWLPPDLQTHMQPFPLCLLFQGCAGQAGGDAGPPFKSRLLRAPHCHPCRDGNTSAWTVLSLTRPLLYLQTKQPWSSPNFGGGSAREEQISLEMIHSKSDHFPCPNLASHLHTGSSLVF